MNQWREVFLLTSGLMHEADDLLVAIEAEAAKFINTDRLKSLFRWAKRIQTTCRQPIQQIRQAAFAIDQYLCFHMEVQ